jgi:hypothetical protein
MIRLYGADNPDALRGPYLDGVVLDEFADVKREERLGPDPRRALGPAAIRAASTGRTRDRTRPILQQRQKVLAMAPSTRDPSRTSPTRSSLRDDGFRSIKGRLTKLLVGPRLISYGAGRPTHWRFRRPSRKNTFGTRLQSERTSEGQFGLATQNSVTRRFPLCCISNHRGHCFNFRHYSRLGLFSSVVADRICGWRLPRACFAPSGTSKA